MNPLIYVKNNRCPLAAYEKRNPYPLPSFDHLVGEYRRLLFPTKNAEKNT